MKKQQYLEEGDCIHGFGRYQCAVCYHPRGCCDFGDCQKVAIVTVGNRTCCAKHGEWLSDWDGKPMKMIGERKGIKAKTSVA